jgi:uncharacterized cupredoxin-like copper-binding protein
VLGSVARNLRLVVLLGAVGVPVALGGCGGEGKADEQKGKQLFVQRCGSCHTLAAADTKGVIGPNLDEAFQESVADGIGRDTIQGVVRDQIKLPLKDSAMPAKLVKGADANWVAAFVADSVAKGGSTGSTGASGATQASGGTAQANARNDVSIPTDPTGQLAYEVTEATAKAGKVTLLSKNASPVPHDISIKDGVNEQGKEVSDGGTSKVTVDLKPGEYTFYCSVPGHEQGGMKGTLTVR